MWDTLADKGMGALLTPWQERREGKARNEVRRAEVLMLAQAEVDANDIRAGRKQLMPDGSLKQRQLSGPLKVEAEVEGQPDMKRLEPALDMTSIIEVSSRTNVAEYVKKEINVSKAILHAEEILENDSQAPSDRAIEDDWISAWREYAGRVSASELQQLWGQILAGEVKSPGSYSLRTLDFVRGLSKKEAEDITRLAPFVVEGRIMKSGRPYFEQKGISFDFLLQMQELGVLTGVEGFGLTTTYQSLSEDKVETLLRSHNKCLLVGHSDASKKLRSDVYILTRVGMELIGLGDFQADIEYLRLVGLSIAGEGYTVGLADWKQETEKSGRYTNKIDIKPVAAAEENQTGGVQATSTNS